MMFRTIYDLRDYAQRFIDVGLGLAQPMLCRRGCDCSQSEVRLGDPGDGHCRTSYEHSMAHLFDALEYRP